MRSEFSSQALNSPHKTKLPSPHVGIQCTHNRLGFLPRSVWNKQTQIRSPSFSEFCEAPPPPSLWDPPDRLEQL